MVSIGFCGDSNVYGVGVTTQTRFPNLVQKDCNVYGVPGACNREIFEQAVESISENDITICMWSAPGRDRFSPHYGLQCTTGNNKSVLSYLSDSKMKTFNDVYHLLDTDYNQIVQLERYTKLLDRLNKNVYYLPGLHFVSDTFFDNKPAKYDNTDERTKQIIQFDHLDDKEIESVVNYCREMYKNIFSSKWIQNKKDIAIDKGTDGIHMGPKSHRQLADKIIKYFKDEGIDIG